MMDGGGVMAAPYSTLCSALQHRQNQLLPLRESGLLASVDKGRQMVQVRRTLEGCPRQVLHLRVGDLAGGLQGAGQY
jgi:hypothetical protein